MPCKYHGQCGFFKKHSEIHKEECEKFESGYCLGQLSVRCEHRKYREANGGAAPSDDMMPNGLMLRDSRLIMKKF